MTNLSNVNEVRAVRLQVLSLKDGIEAPPPVFPVSALGILDRVVANQRSKRYLELYCH